MCNNFFFIVQRFYFTEVKSLDEQTLARISKMKIEFVSKRMQAFITSQTV